MKNRTIRVKVMRDGPAGPVAFECDAEGLDDARHVALSLAGGLGVVELVNLEPMSAARTLGPDAWEPTEEERHAEAIDAEIKVLRLAHLRRKQESADVIGRILGIAGAVIDQRRREGKPVEGQAGFVGVIDDAGPLLLRELERMAGVETPPGHEADAAEERAADVATAAVNSLILSIDENGEALTDAAERAAADPESMGQADAMLRGAFAVIVGAGKVDPPAMLKALDGLKADIKAQAKARKAAAKLDDGEGAAA